MARAKRRSRSRSTTKAAPRRRAGATAPRRRGGARGPWLKRVYKAKNGATYVKNFRDIEIRKMENKTNPY